MAAQRSHWRQLLPASSALLSRRDAPVGFTFPGWWHDHALGRRLHLPGAGRIATDEFSFPRPISRRYQKQSAGKDSVLCDAALARQHSGELASPVLWRSGAWGEDLQLIRIPTRAGRLYRESLQLAGDVSNRPPGAA